MITFDRAGRRKLFSHLMAVLCFGCVLAALIPLLSILYTAAVRGAAALSINFFTKNLYLVPPTCSSAVGSCAAGGVLNAIQGTLVMLGLGALIAIPVGVFAGVFLSEWGHLRGVRWMRFGIEVMTGLPSIVVGIFIYALFLDLVNAGTISRIWVLGGWAGAVALAVIMMPFVTRTTEDALGLVPINLREAGLALGIRRWRVTTSVILSTGRASVVTGVLLAVARAGGETAPLLILTTFSIYPVTSLHGPISALPPLIYFYGLSGFPNYVTVAWGASLVIVGIMLLISVVARLAAGAISTRALLGGG